MKGQITMTNLVVIFVVLILYMALLPAITPMIDQTVAILQENPNDTTPMLVFLLYATPFVILIAIVLTALNWAMPRSPGRGV